MNELAQWIIAGIAVALAAVYLIRRISHPRGSCACPDDCSNCPLGPEFRDQCTDRPNRKPPSRTGPSF